MDHIKWDSDACDEYSIALRKAHQRLDNEIQRLSNAQQQILLFNSDASDQALEKVLSRLKKYILRLKETDARIIKLQKAIENANELFSKAESRIGSMGTNVLYTAVTGSINHGEKPILVSAVHTRFQNSTIHPQWLYHLSEQDIGSNS